MENLIDGQTQIQPNNHSKETTNNQIDIRICYVNYSNQSKRDFFYANYTNYDVEDFMSFPNNDDEVFFLYVDFSYQLYEL